MTGPVAFPAQGSTSWYSYAQDLELKARKPWEFHPEDYGAKGDGRIAGDCAVNGTNTFTSPTVAANATVGQWVMIDGGRGTSDTAAIGTITAINTGTNAVTIDTSARSLPITATTTGLNVAWATDDTAAFNAAMSAGKTYAEAHNYAFTLALQDRLYGIAGLTKTNDGNIIYNTSVPIPRPTNNNGRKLVVTIKGPARNSHHDYWNATVPSIAGAAILCFQFGTGTLDPTYLYQSVFGAGIPVAAGSSMAQPLDTGHANPVFINHKPVFRNVQVVLPVYTHVTAFDFQYSTGAYADACSAYAFACVLYGNGVILLNQYHSALFGGQLGCGMRLPLAGNNADVQVPDLEVVGLAAALSTPSEHTTIGNLKAFMAGTVLSITGSTNGHGLVIERVTAEGYQGGLRNGLTNQPGKVPVFIGLWNTESSANADGGGGYDIYDPSNTLIGEIHWANTVDAGHQFPVVNGASNVRIVCESVYRGLQTAPALPGSTVAFQNPFWRDAKVTVTGGTVTGVAVNGVTEATTTGGTFLVPTGGTITLTYSVAPSWSWRLL